jgi:hypothetical protein
LLTSASMEQSLEQFRKVAEVWGVAEKVDRRDLLRLVVRKIATLPTQATDPCRRPVLRAM